MALETGDYITDLVITNPPGSDSKTTSDDHHRIIKKCVQQTFPNMNAAVTVTPNDLNKLSGFNALTVTLADIGWLDGIAAQSVVASELNWLAGISTMTATHADLNLLAGASSVTATAYTLGVLVGINTPALSGTKFDLDVQATTGVWLLVGPTGSGATAVWTALDTVPTGAKAIIVKSVVSVAGATDTNTYSGSVYFQETGGVTVTIGAASSEANLMASSLFVNRSGLTESDQSTGLDFIPLNGSGTFELGTKYSGNGVSFQGRLLLRGFIK